MDPNIFREYDIRGIVGVHLTDAVVERLSRAISRYFLQNGAKSIVIGYDARESSSRFCELITAGLTGLGLDVVLIGMVPTPVLYHTLYTKDVDGGVMITGSHNPPDHNGFKICFGTAALFGAQIQEIKEIAMSEPPASAGGQPVGEIETLDVLKGYCEDLVSGIAVGPRKLKVVIDAGNGMGGVTAVPVYRAMGIEVIELFTTPDPTFPNHDPDPSVTENLEEIIRSVRENNADLGIAFDGDADRIGVVNETGRIMWGDELMVLFSRSVLAEYPGSVIIAEAKCSQTLFDDIERHGGLPIMWKAGHSIIRAKLKESGGKLAGEMSGHIFFADRYYGFDDAAYAGARLLEVLSNTDKPLSALLADLPKTFSTPEIRVPCSEAAKFTVIEKIAEYFARDHIVNTIDGARITFEHGWGIVRASNTQAILVLRFEADTADQLNKLRATVESKVAEFIAAAL